MKKTILILAISITLGYAASATVHTINNSGTLFVPDEIHINIGDTVVFSLASIHNAIEVSQAIWDANGNTSNGGFSVPFGGGMVTNLGAGMHYYVCELHASMGMKGKIEVSNSTGIEEATAISGFSVFPNPFINQLQINFTVPEFSNDYFEILNLAGQTIYNSSSEQWIGINTIHLDLGELPAGIYFVFIKQKGYGITEKIIKQ